jgi:hypothetical protein
MDTCGRWQAVSSEQWSVTSEPGLCADCVHARRVESRKGSIFWLCRKSETDSRFPRYPALPVLECLGYEKVTSNP